MNLSTSEYSSGCESGWTTYLEQISTDQFYRNCGRQEEEDEDLSMVSDASSGPAPHFHQLKSKTKEAHHLDDTATSPIFNFSLGNVPTPTPTSAHFEGESKAKKHLSFLKSSRKGKSGSLLGRKRQ